MKRTSKNCGTVSKCVICIIRISKGEGKENETENYLKSLDQELSKLVVDTTPHIQEAQRAQNKIIQK